MPVYRKGHACKGKHKFKTTSSGKTMICTRCGSVRPGPKGAFYKRSRSRTKAARRLRR